METWVLIVVPLIVIVGATVIVIVRSRSGVIIEMHRAASESAKAGARVELERVTQRGLLERERVQSADRRYFVQNGIAAFVGVVLVVGIVAAIVTGINTISEDVTNAKVERRREETRRALSADRSYTLTELGYQATIRQMSEQETLRSKAWADAYGRTGYSPHVPASKMNGGQVTFLVLVFVLNVLVMVYAVMYSRRKSRS